MTRKLLLGLVVVAALGAGVWYYQSGASDAAAAPANTAGAGGGAGGARGGRGRGGTTMTVEVAPTGRHEVIDYITVVGNLIGEATVDVVPRVAGRIESIPVKLGDRVTKGQLVAKLEDRALREQINQVRANIDVNQATAVARENDAKVAANNLDRAKTSFERGLVSQQALEDADSRYNSAVSQVTVAKAQLASTQARLEELSVTLSDTSVMSPVDGFVARRLLDQGAFAGANTTMLSVVDISVVRMVANLVEKDFKRIVRGAQALVEVDAFPNEQFTGIVSRVAPIFDPATRTATMEIEVPNPGFRLKPGMYARVRLTAGRNPDALTVPRAALVDIEGKRGVFTIESDVAHFVPVTTGLVDPDRAEILQGLQEGTRVVTTGALAIRDGDRVVVGRGGGGRGGQSRSGRGAAAETTAPQAGGQPPAAPGTPGARSGRGGRGRAGEGAGRSQ
ncbi:MAG: efflux RND transporter periplasmic adaptor subunit [Vicinamibacterales bacterium]